MHIVAHKPHGVHSQFTTRIDVANDHPKLRAFKDNGPNASALLCVLGVMELFAKVCQGEAKELKPGDVIRTLNGNFAKVRKAKRLNKETSVYNFEVEDFHTYFVGQLGFLVQNACTPFGDGFIGPTYQFHNLKPQDTPQPYLRRELFFEGGRWRMSGPNGNVYVPKGQYNFVVQNGKVFISRGPYMAEAGM